MRDMDRHIHFFGRPVERRRECIAGGRQTAPTADGPLDPLLAHILDASGLDPAAYRQRSLERRLRSCLRTLRVTDSAAGLEAVRRTPSLLPEALGAVLLGVSGFWRDPQVFQALSTRVLPELLAGRSRVRVWSAACSDGQELYSVAMIVAKLNGLERTEFLGTDCRPDAITAARLGRYPVQSVESLPADLRSRWVLPARGDIVQVHGELRSRMRWRQADLLEGNPEGAWDLIICRNMIMYLNEPAAFGVWEKLTQALEPGGYLVCGKAERAAMGLLSRTNMPCLFAKSRARSSGVRV